MTTAILPKRSEVASAVPSSGSLQTYEIAVNVTDGRLFVKNSSGSVITLYASDLASKQTLNTNLTAFAGLPGAANKFPYFTGSGALSLADLTSFARSLLDDPDASTMRATLGLGSISTQAASSVAITGGTITGITDLSLADGGTGASSAAGARLNLDVYSKGETDNAIASMAAGLDVKSSVRAAATSNVSSLSGAQTIDGVALNPGDRVLLSGQTTQSANGIYIVAAGAWPRSVDFDDWSEIPGAIVTVESGSANGGSLWLSTVQAGGTIGSTAITLIKLDVGSYTAGSGINIAGGAISLSDTGVSAGTYQRVTVDAKGRVTAANNTTVAISEGGTGANSASAALVALGAAAIDLSNVTSVDGGNY